MNERVMQTPGGPQVVKATKEEMLALRAQGLNNAEIAARLGVSRVLVRKKIGGPPVRTISAKRTGT